MKRSMRGIKGVAIVALIVCSARCGRDEFAMSNRQAIELASNRLAESDTTFSFGSLAFVSRDPNPSF